MAVTLHRATDADLPVVLNLVPLYLHDMSEHTGWPCNADGTFTGCDRMASYWQEPGKHAFVLKNDKELAGFAMVRGNHDEPDIDFSIAEFFVLRKFRRRGVGQYVAAALFDQFRGRWMVEVFMANTVAIEFWGHATASMAARSVSRRDDDHGERRVIFFDNR